MAAGDAAYTLAPFERISLGGVELQTENGGMGKFERMRDRLPSLYRPDDDDVEAELRPLRAADILEMRGTDTIPFAVPRAATERSSST